MKTLDTFLNAEIHSPMFLAIPEGLNEDREKTVISLRRSIYGLKTSSKSWKMPKNTVALLLVYVDDMLLLTDSDDLRTEVTTALQEKFRITCQPDPKFFVGFEINRDFQNNVITLAQTKYIDRILKRFNMDQCHLQNTPMETSLKLQKSATGKDDTEYRAMIGALLYVARGTRPDIAFALNTLSKLQTCSTENDKNYVRRIFRYLKGTRDYVLPYYSKGEHFEAFVDASYAPDVSESSSTLDLNQGKSITGYVLRIFNDPILWGVRKQSIVASSSTAAEVIAIHDAVDDMRVGHFLMHEIFDLRTPITVWEDNISATRIIMGGEQKRNRCTLIKCYDVLEAVAAKEIELKNISSSQQLADALTKPLDKVKFSKFVNHIFFPYGNCHF